MVVEKSSTSSNSNNPLEQFVLLAKSTKGAACLELIKQVLEAPGVYVFGELLDMPNIAELKEGPGQVFYDTLNLFAYGTYKDYIKDQSKFLELVPSQIKKLQHLTVVTLATKIKCLPYAMLLEELSINNVRDLEDLIIEAIYADIVHGKLDQKNSQLEVDYAIGRDIRKEEIGSIQATLQEWSDTCEAVLACVETQITRANNEKNCKVKQREEIDQEIQTIKRSLKAQAAMQAVDSDEAMAVDLPEVICDKTKKSAKGKVRVLS